MKVAFLLESGLFFIPISAERLRTMKNIDKFRNALDVSINKLSIDALVHEICNKPEYLKDMHQLISDEKQAVSWRAIWVCEKVSELYPSWFAPLYNDILQRLLVCRHEGSKRLLLSILYNIPAPTPIPVDLLNYCLDHMLSPKESIGVQALSIRMAYKLCKLEPELLKELQLILENTDTEYYSSSVRSAIRNIFKKIKK